MGTGIENYEDTDGVYEPSEKEVEIVAFESYIQEDGRVYITFKVKNNGDKQRWCWEICKLDAEGKPIQCWKGIRTFEYTSSHWCKIGPVSGDAWKGRLRVGVATFSTDWERHYTDSKEFQATKQ